MAQTSNETFFDDLVSEGYAGEWLADKGQLAAWSGDNSLYEVFPWAVVFPKSVNDLSILARLSERHGRPLAARGGGTGTNGQSLSDGIVVDVGRFMRQIIDLDTKAGQVTVEPGVVLDQLNAYLSPHGWFFPPSVSTASRATIGGMIATDASGKGSRIYGRTSDYIETMEIVLANGDRETIDGSWNGGDHPTSQLDAIRHELHSKLHQNRGEIERVFPRMNRGLTGYNLLDGLNEDGSLCLPKLLAGSEGTLALTGRIKLKLRRKPAESTVAVLTYDDFMQALGEVPPLLKAEPFAVEIIDDRILELAMTDPIWEGLKDALGNLGKPKAMLFVEFCGDDSATLDEGIERLNAVLETAKHQPTFMRVVADKDDQAGIWALRSRSVGLLGSLEGRRSGCAFVEDCAVPTGSLRPFVEGFRSILDSHSVAYGMFGHADVGCLHVRPTLDMTAPEDRDRVRQITDAVAALAKEHGGLLWGEHGRGYRGEFSQFFFGDTLYDCVRDVKTAFDPHNRLNPWKLAVPKGVDGELIKIDEARFRGISDGSLASDLREEYDRAVACNGNGACHDWDAASAMCPSYKVTRDTAQSPKGRAALIRQWARLRTDRQSDDPELLRAESALARSLETCLSCQACSSQCPVRVDIPTMKSKFLESYYASRSRPLRDRVIRLFEPFSLTARRFPAIVNGLVRNRLVRSVAERQLDLVDLPSFSGETLEAGMRRIGVERHRGGKTDILLLCDSFTASFETNVPVATALYLKRIGLNVQYVPPFVNGKGLQVRGYLNAFDRNKNAVIKALRGMSSSAEHIVSIEPVATLTLQKMLGNENTSIEGLADFLSDRASIDRLPKASAPTSFSLLPHCTEKTADPSSPKNWCKIFEAAGQNLSVVRAGCCGMAGLFGHEREHVPMSKALFDLSWRGAIDNTASTPLATGFSCRSQLKRHTAHQVKHPIEALLATTEPA